MYESVEQLDPTEVLSTDTIKTRAVKGVAVLTGRMVLMQGISFLATALLTFFLAPSEFGIFFVVSALKNFLAYFSDIGFAAALIQKKEKPTENELRTIFTAQQILVCIILLIVFLATPVIEDFYKLDRSAVYLLWVLLLSLIFSSLKTIPSVLLERKLEFNKLVIPQVVENIIFNMVAVFLAWKGFGISSFTIAIFLSGLIGLILMYIVQPWFPKPAFSTRSFKSILNFGIPYQINTFLAMIKDDGMILFLGSYIGPSGIGLLGWAQKWAYAPLRFFMDQVIRVTFPAFSRLQSDKKDLSDLVTKAIFFICLLVFPSLIMLLILAPILVQIIPKYIKWEGALFALSVLTISSALAAITTPLTNVLNAIGKIAVTFKLMVMWTVLTWILVPLLAFIYGLNGAAIGFTLVGLSSFVALYLVSKYVDINYLKSVGKPLIAAVLMGLTVNLVKNILPVSLQQVVTLIIVGLISYSLVMIALEPRLFQLSRGLFGKKV